MAMVNRDHFAFFSILVFILILRLMCFFCDRPAHAVSAAELEIARQAYQKAYETYTRLATTGGKGDINQALAEYKQAYFRYQRLKNEAETAPPPAAPAKAVVRPATTPTIALNLDRFTHPIAPANTPQTITFGNRLTVTVPAGALKAPQTLFIHPMTASHIDIKRLGPLSLFDIRMGGQTRFDPPLVIEIRFDPVRLSKDLYVQSQLLTATYDEAENRWRFIPCRVDMTQKRLIITTNHLSGYADFYIRDQMVQQAIQRELDALKRSGQVSVQRVAEVVNRLAQPLITKATSAYDAASGTLGKAWARARNAYNFAATTVSNTVESGKKTIGDVYDSAVAAYNVSADLASTLKTYNLGACHLTPHFRIYYTEADILDPTKIIYKGSGAPASRNIVMSYATVKGFDTPVVSDTVQLSYTPPPPTAPPKVIPEYIRDMGTALDAAYAYYRKNYKVPEGFTDVVVCGSNIDPFYEKITKFILINYNVMTYDQMRTTVAHEFFHRIQNLYVNVLDMKRFLWLLEASAEYVSIEEVCGLPMSRFRKIGLDFLKQPLFATGNEREYVSGHFFRYLAQRRGFSIKGFFRYFAKTYGMASTESYLDTYLRNTMKTGLADAYAGFAADLLLSSGGALAKTDVYTAFNQFPQKLREVKRAGTETALTLSTAAFRTAAGGIRANMGSTPHKFTLSLLEKERQGMAQVYLLPGNVKPADPRPVGTLVEPGDSARVTMKHGDVVYLLGTNQSPEGGLFFVRMASAGIQCRTDLTQAQFEVIGAKGARYEWDFGDGVKLTTSEPRARHDYNYTFKPASGGPNPFGEDLQFDTKVYPIKVRIYNSGGKLLETLGGEARLSPLKSVKTSP
jgi:hypothetical protein